MSLASDAGPVAIWSYRGHIEGSALTENTPGAVEAALAGGADGVEIDVWATSDGTFVLHHDPAVDGVVIQRAPSSLLRRLPTLEDVLEVAGSSTLDVELKLLPETGVRAAVEASVRLVELVRERDALISSFDERAVRACLASGARAGLLVEEAPSEATLRDLEELGLRWLLVDVGLLRQGCNNWPCQQFYGLIMNRREWAESQGIHPQTAYKWYRQGKLPVPARKMGKLMLVGDLEASAAPGPRRTVIDARVSSADQRADLDRQVARVVAWATEHGHSVDQVVTEIGSALHGHRRKCVALLRDTSVTTIILEHRDRFCRFGAECVEAARKAQGRRLVVVDPSEVDDDLVRDATELLTSLCARLDGKRSAAKRANRAIEVACAEAVP